MADLIETKIRNAISYNLKKIITGNTILDTLGRAYTFNTTIHQIGDPPKARASFSDIPAINLFFMEEAASKIETGDNMQNINMKASVFFDVLLQYSENLSLIREQAKADIIALFSNLYTIPDENNIATVKSITYKSSQYYGIEVNNPDCGVILGFELSYRLTGNNPYYSN